MVRVDAASFAAAIAVLQAHYAIKQPQNWTVDFASFGDDTGGDIPLGVQLVAKDSESDFFLFLRDQLIANASLLAEYNQLKLTHAGDGPEGYWQAKNTFLTRLLAGWRR